jgi:hypothetical protein
MAEHSINLGHHIKLQDTTILSTESRYMNQMIREAIEMELHPNNMNREVGSHLSQSWELFIHSFKGCRKHLIEHCQSLPGHYTTTCPFQDIIQPQPTPCFLCLISYVISSIFSSYISFLSSVVSTHDSIYLVIYMPEPWGPYKGQFL